MISFTANVVPVTFKRTFSHGTRRFNDARYTKFKADVGYFARRAMDGRPPPFGPVKISVDVFQNLDPTALKFGDADNHLKAVCDALNGICFCDDRQVVVATVRLHRGEPRIEIELEEI